MRQRRSTRRASFVAMLPCAAPQCQSASQVEMSVANLPSTDLHVVAVGALPVAKRAWCPGNFEPCRPHLCLPSGKRIILPPPLYPQRAVQQSCFRWFGGWRYQQWWAGLWITQQHDKFNLRGALRIKLPSSIAPLIALSAEMFNAVAFHTMQ